jgi:hypothetical protein
VTVGWQPRMPTYQQFGCGKAQIHETAPAVGAALEAAAADMAALLRQYVPEQAAQQAAMVEAVRPEYRLPGGLFTGGIVNRTTALRYHQDRLNFKGSWSAMVVLRSGVDGGHLAVPELGVTLACPDASVVLFDGQRFWHGVTPLAVHGRRGVRLSVVWYARRDMCACLAWEDELAAAARSATRSAEARV